MVPWPIPDSQPSPIFADTERHFCLESGQLWHPIEVRSQVAQRCLLAASTDRPETHLNGTYITYR